MWGSRRSIQIEKGKSTVTVVCSCSPNNLEFGHFTWLFCRKRQRSVPKCNTHVQSPCTTFFTPLFCGVLNAVVVVVSYYKGPYCFHWQLGVFDNSFIYNRYVETCLREDTFRYSWIISFVEIIFVNTDSAMRASRVLKTDCLNFVFVNGFAPNIKLRKLLKKVRYLFRGFL